jgi:uncharacterized protein
MKCPACGYLLTSRKAGDISVDTCEGGCGGVWFDNFELRRVDAAGAESLSHVARDPMLRVDHESKRRCPRCADQVMRRRFFSRLRGVVVDECPECAGLWLDAGEFEAVQKESVALAAIQASQAGAMSVSLANTVAHLRERSRL